MVCNHSIRLKVSLDADFVPVLTKSVVDFASTLDVSNVVKTSVQKEVALFFAQDLADVDESNLFLNVAVENRQIVISVEGAGRRMLAKRVVSFA